MCLQTIKPLCEKSISMNITLLKIFHTEWEQISGNQSIIYSEISISILLGDTVPQVLNYGESLINMILTTLSNVEMW